MEIYCQRKLKLVIDNLNQMEIYCRRALKQYLDSLKEKNKFNATIHLPGLLPVLRKDFRAVLKVEGINVFGSKQRAVLLVWGS
jgi:hypothetical protein